MGYITVSVSKTSSVTLCNCQNERGILLLFVKFYKNRHKYWLNQNGFRIYKICLGNESKPII